MAAGLNETTPVNWVSDLAFVYRSLFYLVTPNETSFATMEEVPNYNLKSLSYAPIILGTELFLLWIQGKRLPRLNDATVSMSCILLIYLPVAVVGHLEMDLYSWVHENYRLIDLPWNAWYTWLLCIFAVDLGFYLWHRAAHEINFLWAFHQVHHTPEDFNVFVGIRLPSLNRYLAIFFYLPCAFFFPPSVFSTHYQLNYLYQFWIHTAAIPGLGIFDYIINNPSLHRVHHGRNRYCIDKNYGAVFSFWDYLFGTFEKERDDEEIFYGLVHPVNSWDSVYIQIHHLKYMWNKTFDYQNISDKISVFLKGPGWYPGAPRLGNIEDIPEIPEDKSVYDKKLPLIGNLYLFLHLTLGYYLFQKIKFLQQVYGATSAAVWGHAIFVFLAVANIGYLLEHKPYFPFLEIFRCLGYFILERFIHDALVLAPTWLLVLRASFLLSFLYWVFNYNMFKKGKEKTR